MSISGGREASLQIKIAGDKGRSDEALPAESLALAVMIVHGTFPRGFAKQALRNLRALWCRVRGRKPEEADLWPTPASRPDQRRWFESGSAFERDLARRSGLPPDCIAFDRFLWSGRNTFADRAEAAGALRAALREAARRRPGIPQVVLAHSHGGTVAARALDARDEDRDGPTPETQAALDTRYPVRAARASLDSGG